MVEGTNQQQDGGMDFSQLRGEKTTEEQLDFAEFVVEEILIRVTMNITSHVDQRFKQL